VTGILNTGTVDFPFLSAVAIFETLGEHLSSYTENFFYKVSLNSQNKGKSNCFAWHSSFLKKKPKPRIFLSKKYRN
jgi:hypothetical protein